MRTLSPLLVLLTLVFPGVMTAAGAQPETPNAHGFWEGSFEQEKTQVRVELDLRVDSSGISGVVTVQGREHHFQNGTVNGEEIQFTTPRIHDSLRNVEYVWSGVVRDDRIKFGVAPADNVGPIIDLVVTRPGAQ